ncbi:phosphatidylserine/phosphatidylglycerophosphate/cardiolipin synthase family protein [Caballeronia sp. EK]|uniref:phospholipase D-like domain-containing protein n=1 Tax=Caballeronia sp. EK TaxID=2767469 RepID=UPI0016551D47|nr:phospholipase D-like domain-containing protein [Caballeronia sp. EK]MBC8636885.1 phosphatidylserine/phosphatidylglycerophosphate/cardiolipin synthase family protein [Caballeronia sp. EK]
MPNSNPIVTPIALSSTSNATITLPWFVQKTEYDPADATYRQLVNGEEAFGAVYDAILQAKKTIDIICWGFQPSMYFKRGDQSAGYLTIGTLLCKRGEEGVKVRLLCWMDISHLAEISENNMPGNTLATDAQQYLPDAVVKRIPVVSSMFSHPYETVDQIDFDREWYRRANKNNVTKSLLLPLVSKSAIDDLLTGPIPGWVETMLGKGSFKNIDLATRGFDVTERAEIAFRTALFGKDQQRSASGKAMNGGVMGAFATHHQKMVLVDYEDPENSVGFVMGHNMLDAYWDKDNHSCIRQAPAVGRNGLHPRHDISSRVSGPILKSLNDNFCEAWDDATGEYLSWSRRKFAKQLRRRTDLGDYSAVRAQILRTQSQYGKRDIEKVYLQAANNVSKFIYIENQYFRFVPFAEKVKAAVAAQIKQGRSPDNPIYLFVITNSNDEGIGPGTVNTYRMLDALGCSDQIPTVAGLEREDARQAELRKQASQADFEATMAEAGVAHATQLPGSAVSAAKERAKAARGRAAQIRKTMKEKPGPVLPVPIPGLKMHICTLVAPDSPQGAWDYVYIHAKLMIVDDVFTTQGSANLNTRSMEGDSELNICHESAEVSKPLRKRLWALHTKVRQLGRSVKQELDGAQEDVGKAFRAWAKLLELNDTYMKLGQSTPLTSIVRFMRLSADRQDSD